MEVALRFLHGYCTGIRTSGSYELLAAHEESIFILYNMAIVLRQVLAAQKMYSIVDTVTDGQVKERDGRDRGLNEENAEEEDIEASVATSNEDGRNNGNLAVKKGEHTPDILSKIFAIMQASESHAEAIMITTICSVSPFDFDEHHVPHERDLEKGNVDGSGLSSDQVGNEDGVIASDEDMLKGIYFD